jgi:transcriptional regulator with XRE-family HTH domain
MKMLKFYDEIKNFEKNYRFLRKKTGKSQKQICEAVHMEQPDLSNIENGKKDITLNVIIALAFAMNMNPVRLFAICMLSPDKIRHIQLNSISISEKERMIQATADGFPKKEPVNESFGEVFRLKESYSQLIEDEFPELKTDLQQVVEGLRDWDMLLRE